MGALGSQRVAVVAEVGARVVAAGHAACLGERGVEIERDYFRMDELAQDLIGRWNHDR